jgi:hypothetical protein
MRTLTDDHVEVLVGVRWNPDRTDYVPGTSHDHLCAECGRFVALAPSSRALLRRPGVRVICVRCLPDLIERSQ